MNNPFSLHIGAEDIFLVFSLNEKRQIWVNADWHADDDKPVEIEIGLTKFDTPGQLGRIVWEVRVWPLPHIWRRWNEKAFGGC